MLIYLAGFLINLSKNEGKVGLTVFGLKQAHQGEKTLDQIQYSYCALTPVLAPFILFFLKGR